MLDLPRPRRGDVTLAGALLIASMVEALIAHDGNGTPGLVFVVSVLTTTGLAWRRSSPGIAVAGSIAGLLLPIALDAPADNAALLVAYLLAMHAVNAYGSRRAAMGWSAALLAAVVGSVVLASPRTAGDLQWACVLFALAAGAGQVMARQARANRLAAVAAEREAVAAERRSVAADLHDVIAHGLALMVVQAGAAAAVLDSDPERSKELLNGVQDTGERAASELHHLLSILAPERTHDADGPAQGFGQLHSLAEGARSGGAAVDVNVIGDVARIPEGLSRACYRIVQESVTNAIKHAPGGAVLATVVIDREQLGILVENIGGTIAPQPTLPHGYGLVAMRERVALFEGTLSAGPTPNGWRTCARFPLDHKGGGGT